MQDEKNPIQFRDASHVSQVMKSINDQMQGQSTPIGEGMAATLARAIAKLADEIETLKNQKT